MKITIFLFLIYFTNIYGSEKGFGPGEQDYGYVTVREGAHMFWWLYHTTANVSDSAERPLIVWLMGGPGGSSCGHANFMIVGPLDEKLEPREHTWVNDFNLLLIDSPVGAGYSYVDDLQYLNTNNAEIASDLVEVMKGFFEKNPKFKTTPLYVYGISYGGKTATDFTKRLYDEIQLGNVEANLKGLSMGNAWISPIDSTLAYAQYLYQVSLIDEDQQSVIEQHALTIKGLIDDEQYLNAYQEWILIFEAMYRLTDGADLYNIINKRQMSLPRTNSKIDLVALDELLNGPVKEALGIPENVIFGSQSADLSRSLREDFMTAVINTIDDILTNTDIDVHVCNGNLDVIVSTPGVISWINRLTWPDENLYKNAPRTTIWLNDTMEGYQRVGGRFHFYWINVAGHDAITDNPSATRYFLRSITGV